MRLPRSAVFGVALLVSLSATTDRVLAHLFCNRTYSELTLGAARPFNAVGFLNNGCTAFLIGPNHIVAAAHCFTFDDTGAWQTGLRFYPNFHPNRVVADETRIPRGDVTRAVVGSRVPTEGLGNGRDWGIARIENWRDTAGLDMTPLALHPSPPTVGMSLSNPAYTRHHFPFDDTAPPAWDDMERDTTHCGSVGSAGGMWAILMRTAPIHDGTNRDRVACNSRWGAGYIHANCSVKEIKDHRVLHNCDALGGSSGSPILNQGADNVWRVVGVQHGGGGQDFSVPAPVCSADIPANHDSLGPSVERFRHAPRFALHTAVGPSPASATATAVFAIDGDLNRVAYRTRTGSAPTHESAFGFWQDLGRRQPAGTRPGTLTRIAACAGQAGKPQIFVVSNKATIHTRSVLPNGTWGPWLNFGIPAAAGSVVDIQTARDFNGRCQLFMVADGGNAFTRKKTSDMSWGTWAKVASGSYKGIAALNFDGVVSVALLDTAGDIWRLSLGRRVSPSPKKLPRPGGIVWRGVAMTHDEHDRGFLLAISTAGGNRLRFLPMFGDNAWTGWNFFDTHLWAPGQAPQDAPDLQSIAASHWMEDKAGATSPVVFATDAAGNVYFIEYARVDTPGWVLDWKSFYHERIVYK